MILVFGSINMDLVTEVAAIPRPGETVLSADYALLFGGKGANQAVAAARVAARRGDVAMVGCVGDDQFGQACVRNLEANGIDVGTVGKTVHPTGCAFINVDRQGENAITVAIGSNARLDASAVPKQFLAPRTTGIFQMEVPFAASLEVARLLKAAGGRVVWNFAPAPGDFARADLLALLSVTDVFVVNEIEARSAAAILGTIDLGLESDARSLAAVGETTCVVTAGERGAFAFTSDGQRLHALAASIRPIDTTGAGDTFVGILSAELEAGVELQDALRKATIAASLACLKKGAQSAMPTRVEIEAFIRGSQEAIVTDQQR